MNKLIAILLISTIILPVVQAQPQQHRVLRVPQDYPTIQEAINAAQPGDTILLSPGAYHENIIIYVSNITIEGTGTVTLEPLNPNKPVATIATTRIKIKNIKINTTGTSINLWGSPWLSITLENTTIKSKTTINITSKTKYSEIYIKSSRIISTYIVKLITNISYNKIKIKIENSQLIGQIYLNSHDKTTKTTIIINNTIIKNSKNIINITSLYKTYITIKNSKLISNNPISISDTDTSLAVYNTTMHSFNNSINSIGIKIRNNNIGTILFDRSSLYGYKTGFFLNKNNKLIINNSYLYNNIISVYSYLSDIYILNSNIVSYNYSVIFFYNYRGQSLIINNSTIISNNFSSIDLRGEYPVGEHARVVIGGSRIYSLRFVGLVSHGPANITIRRSFISGSHSVYIRVYAWYDVAGAVRVSDSILNGSIYTYYFGSISIVNSSIIGAAGQSFVGLVANSSLLLDNVSLRRARDENASLFVRGGEGSSFFVSRIRCAGTSGGPVVLVENVSRFTGRDLGVCPGLRVALSSVGEAQIQGFNAARGVVAARNVSVLRVSDSVFPDRGLMLYGRLPVISASNVTVGDGSLLVVGPGSSISESVWGVSMLVVEDVEDAVLDLGWSVLSSGLYVIGSDSVELSNFTLPEGAPARVEDTGRVVLTRARLLEGVPASNASLVVYLSWISPGAAGGFTGNARLYSPEPLWYRAGNVTCAGYLGNYWGSPAEDDNGDYVGYVPGGLYGVDPFPLVLPPDQYTILGPVVKPLRAEALGIENGSLLVRVHALLEGELSAIMRGVIPVRETIEKCNTTLNISLSPVPEGTSLQVMVTLRDLAGHVWTVYAYYAPSGGGGGNHTGGGHEGRGEENGHGSPKVLIRRIPAYRPVNASSGGVVDLVVEPGGFREAPAPAGVWPARLSAAVLLVLAVSLYALRRARLEGEV